MNKKEKYEFLYIQNRIFKNVMSHLLFGKRALMLDCKHSEVLTEHDDQNKYTVCYLCGRVWIVPLK